MHIESVLSSWPQAPPGKMISALLNTSFLLPRKKEERWQPGSSWLPGEVRREGGGERGEDDAADAAEHLFSAGVGGEDGLCHRRCQQP